MRTLFIFHLLVASLLANTVKAEVFKTCESNYQTESKIADEIRTAVSRTTPAKYHAQISKEIKINFGGHDDPFFPYATVASDGSKIIQVRVDYLKFVCSQIVAQLIAGTHDNLEIEMMVLKKKLSSCLSSQNFGTCFNSYTAELAANFSDKEHATMNFVAIRSDASNINVVNASLGILRHEYAHHLLGHFKKLSEGFITRADAEFEADYFSAIPLTITGKDALDLAPFFQFMASVEKDGGYKASSNYEATSCRANFMARAFSNIGVGVLSALTVIQSGPKNDILDDAYFVLAERMVNGEDLIHAEGKNDLPCELSADLLRRIAALKSQVSQLYRDAWQYKPYWTNKSHDTLGPSILLFELINSIKAKNAEMGLAQGALISAILFRLANDGHDVSNQLLTIVSDSEISEGMMGGNLGTISHMFATSLFTKKSATSNEDRMKFTVLFHQLGLDLGVRSNKAMYNLGLIRIFQGNCESAVRLFGSLEALNISKSMSEVSKSLLDLAKSMRDDGSCVENGEKMRIRYFSDIDFPNQQKDQP